MDKFLSKQQLANYQKEIAKCKKYGGQSGSECAEKVILKYLRKTPGMKDTVYPWANYDWSYDIFIDNNYNKNKTGATPKGNFPALFKNPIALTKLNNAYFFDGNPSKKSKAAFQDIKNCHGDSGCNLINEIRKSYLKQRPPYKDKFFSRKLDGEYSSSYFIKTGSCLRNLDKKKCLEKGYQWTDNPLYKLTPSFLRPKTFKPGSCYQNKYGFVNNKSGFDLKIPKTNDKQKNKNIDKINKNISKFKGSLPSLLNDLSSLSPEKIANIIKGESSDSFEIMKCPETFCNYVRTWAITNEQYIFIGLFLLILLMVIIMIIYNYYKN